MEMTEELQEIPLDIALKVGDIFSFDCFIKLPNGKMIKVSRADGEDIIETFEKYKEKGVDKFYATKDDILEFLKIYQQRFTQKIFDPKTTERAKVESLSNTFELTKQTFIKFGINPVTIDVAQKTALQGIQFIRNVPNLFHFFKDFKNSCSNEFMNMMLVNYMCSIILENFDWSSSEVKKKLSLAVLLSDITLGQEDFALLRKYEDNDYDKLPDHILNHPTEVAELIRGSRHYGVPLEVAQIVEQHHELPNRKGFPNHLDHTRITLFSAIYIVSYHFVKEVSLHNFDFTKLDLIITRMNDLFQTGNFAKVLKVLLDVLAK